LGVWVFTPSHSLALSCTPGSMWCDSRASSWLNSRASSCLSSRASFWLNSRPSLWLNSRASLWPAPLQFPLPWSRAQARVVTLYNTNGFGTQTMYDYYIAMKSMFLVAKLFSHPFIVYASLTILLPWTKHKQHQNHSKLKARSFSQFYSIKLCICTTIL